MLCRLRPMLLRPRCMGMRTSALGAGPLGPASSSHLVPALHSRSLVLSVMRLINPSARSGRGVHVGASGRVHLSRQQRRDNRHAAGRTHAGSLHSCDSLQRGQRNTQCRELKCGNFHARLKISAVPSRHTEAGPMDSSSIGASALLIQNLIRLCSDLRLPVAYKARGAEKPA